LSTPLEPPDAGARSPRVWWQGLPRRRRRVLRALFAVCVVAVLAGGALLARFLSVENAERTEVVALLQAEAKGDLNGMLVRLDGCRASPTCVAGARADASDPRVRRAGAIKILQLESPTAYSLSDASGRTRVAWTVIGKLPVVQCVDVRRSGSFIAGIHVHLLAISAPISGEGRCTKATRLEREEEEETRAQGQ
jgi:hypothetical protein